LIGFSLFSEIALSKRAEKFEKIGYIFSFSLSFALAVIPFVVDNYGPLDPYQCWITSNHLNLLVFYTPVCIVVIFDFIFIFYVINFLRKLQGNYRSREIMLKFLMFPIILVFAWLPGFIRMVGDIDNIILDGFMYVLMPMQGILNPFIYGSIFTIVKQELFGKKVINDNSINKVNDISKISTQRMTYEDLINIQKELKNFDQFLLKENNFSKSEEKENEKTSDGNNIV